MAVERLSDYSISFHITSQYMFIILYDCTVLFSRSIYLHSYYIKLDRQKFHTTQFLPLATCHTLTPQPLQAAWYEFSRSPARQKAMCHYDESALFGKASGLAGSLARWNLTTVYPVFKKKAAGARCASRYRQEGRTTQEKKGWLQHSGSSHDVTSHRTSLVQRLLSS